MKILNDGTFRDVIFTEPVTADGCSFINCMFNNDYDCRNCYFENCIFLYVCITINCNHVFSVYRQFDSS